MLRPTAHGRYLLLALFYSFLYFCGTKVNLKTYKIHLGELRCLDLERGTTIQNELVTKYNPAISKTRPLDTSLAHNTLLNKKTVVQIVPSAASLDSPDDDTRIRHF